MLPLRYRMGTAKEVLDCMSRSRGKTTTLARVFLDFLHAMPLGDERVKLSKDYIRLTFQRTKERGPSTVLRVLGQTKLFEKDPESYSRSDFLTLFSDEIKETWLLELFPYAASSDDELIQCYLRTNRAKRGQVVYEIKERYAQNPYLIFRCFKEELQEKIDQSEEKIPGKKLWKIYEGFVSKLNSHGFLKDGVACAWDQILVKSWLGGSA